MTFSPNKIVKATEASPSLPRPNGMQQDEFMRATAFALEAIAKYGTLPVGTVVEYTGTLPDSGGWLLCDGSSAERGAFPQLWVHAQESIAAGYTNYGEGDGSTTFTLPDARGVAVTAPIDPPTVVVDDGGSVNVGDTAVPTLPDIGGSGGSGGGGGVSGARPTSATVPL